MTQQLDKEEGSLSFNRSTGLYEGTIRIGIDAEFFRRKLFQRMEENESADLSNPEVLLAIIRSVSKASIWLGHPHTRILTTSEPSLPREEPPGTPGGEQPQGRTKMRRGSLIAALRERARGIPPHLWEERCLSPYGDAPSGSKERGRIGSRRGDERAILQKLRVEWEAGTFILEREAVEEEERYQQEQSDKLTQKLEVVALAVNSNGFH